MSTIIVVVSHFILLSSWTGRIPDTQYFAPVHPNLHAFQQKSPPLRPIQYHLSYWKTRKKQKDRGTSGPHALQTPLWGYGFVSSDWTALNWRHSSCMKEPPRNREGRYDCEVSLKQSPIPCSNGKVQDLSHTPAPTNQAPSDSSHQSKA
jgi:hypothetical protein